MKPPPPLELTHSSHYPEVAHVPHTLKGTLPAPPGSEPGPRLATPWVHLKVPQPEQPQPRPSWGELRPAQSFSPQQELTTGPWIWDQRGSCLPQQQKSLRKRGGLCPHTELSQATLGRDGAAKATGSNWGARTEPWQGQELPQLPTGANLLRKHGTEPPWTGHRHCSHSAPL